MFEYRVQLNESSSFDFCGVGVEEFRMMLCRSRTFNVTAVNELYIPNVSETGAAESISRRTSLEAEPSCVDTGQPRAQVTIHTFL